MSLSHLSDNPRTGVPMVREAKNNLIYNLYSGKEGF